MQWDLQRGPLTNPVNTLPFDETGNCFFTAVATQLLGFKEELNKEDLPFLAQLLCKLMMEGAWDAMTNPGGFPCLTAHKKVTTRLGDIVVTHLFCNWVMLNQLTGTWATPHTITLLGRAIWQNILTVTMRPVNQLINPNSATPSLKYMMTLTRPAGWEHLSQELWNEINNAPAIVVKHRNGSQFELFGPGQILPNWHVNPGTGYCVLSRQ